MVIAKLEKIKIKWEKETDEWLLKAATENIDEYSKEVRIIICEEATKRGLIKYAQKENNSNGIDITVTEKGQEVLADVNERSPKVVSVKLGKTIIVFVLVCILSGIVSLSFGLPEGIITACGGYFVYLYIEKVWSKAKK